jgi:assimilatory nitrate reductase catalytic subunit
VNNVKKTQSTCNYCALACNLDFYEEENEIVKIVPRPGYPVNNGFSCIKGLKLSRQTQEFKPNPLPKIRKAGQTVHVNWQEGIAETAARLNEIRETYGDSSIAGISTGQIPFEEMALLGHIMRNYLKAHLDGNTRLCMATSVVAHKQSFGFDAPGYTLKDVELSDTIIFLGANPVVAHPIFWKRVRANQVPGKKVIVLDPRHSETAIQADYHYELKPKADLLLLYILAQVLLERNWLDATYIEKSTEKFSEFREFLADYPLSRAAETGLTAQEIVELATLIHQGKKVSFWWTMGVNQGYEAVRTAQAIINIALMTGNIGRPGTGANSLTGQSNAMGSRLFSNQTSLYGGGNYDNPAERQKVAQVLNMAESWLPEAPSLPYNAIIEQINQGKIKALWVVATNPEHSWSNSQEFTSAMEKLDLLIVQDLYEDTVTAKMADIFLPVVPGIKKEGTYINTERRLSAMRPVITPAENEKSDYQVLYQIGVALGMGDLLKGWETPEAAFHLMRACTKGLPSDFTGVDYQKMPESNGFQWPYPAGSHALADERRLFEDGHYYTPSGKAQFVFETPLSDPAKPTADFPYLLNTGRGTVGQWHTHTRTREIPEVVAATEKAAFVQIHPVLAQKLAVHQKDQVAVTSINGQTQTFLALITNEVAPNQIYAPMHYVEVNKLTLPIFDKYSKEPSYKTTPVSIKKL